MVKNMSEHDPDGPSEEQARLLMEVLMAPNATLPFTGVPPAFHASGKMPVEEEGKTTFNRGSQLAAQRLTDRTNLHRTMGQMGGRFGFRGNDKKK